MKKLKRSKKAVKNSKRTKVTTKLSATPVTRSKAARAHIAEGTRLFALAGRPTKAQFVKVYGAKGPTMTWAQRAKAGVPAEKIQAALKAKSRAKQDRPSIAKGLRAFLVLTYLNKADRKIILTDPFYFEITGATPFPQ